MKTNKSKRQRDIKSKLIAAICMLLVSSIMMVSSTYAWFTLSTAPEVTGITTAVGANGNLEMALLPLTGDVDEITANQGDSMAMQDAQSANVTWGNLVDLTSGYGLDQIVLYPSELNVVAAEEAGKPDKIATTGILKTPTYGADGRIADLKANTFAGVYANDGFYQTVTDGDKVINTPYGVRGIGTISSMSPRELAYRLAMSTASTAATQAGGAASATMSNNGAALSQIALKHVMATEEKPDKYTKTDVDYLLNIVDGLLGTDVKTGALTYIENALKQYVLAANIAPAAADAKFQTIVDAINAPGVTVYGLAGIQGVTIPAEISAQLTKLTAIHDKLADAQEKLNDLKKTAEPYTWDQLSTTMSTLINVEKVIFLGPDGYLDENAKDGKPDELTASQIQGGDMNKMTTFGVYVLANDMNMIMREGSGIFVEIADFCGDFTASFVMPETQTHYVTIPADAMDVVMSADTALTESTIYLTAARTAAGSFVSAGGSAGDSPISDFYGYIIDMAFRTNAAGSYLKLQQEGADRIYSDGTNTNTQGGGAVMSFTSGDTNFSVASMKNLMNAIKIVFFDPSAEGKNEIIGYAKLDGTAATEDVAASKVTMPLVMCEKNGTALTGDAAIKIMDLNQNEIHQLSVLVYLDGNKVGNDDVATTARSLVGSMNLQFSSSANLVAMDYANLKSGDGGKLNGGNGGSEEPAAPAVSKYAADKVSITGAASAEAAYATYPPLGNGVCAIIKGADGAPITTGTVTINDTPAIYNETAGGWVAVIAEKPESVTIVYTA